jgi:hypothetical protein
VEGDVKEGDVVLTSGSLAGGDQFEAIIISSYG